MSWLLSLLSVLVVSALSLVGLATLGSTPAQTRGVAQLLVSFAVGSLLGDAFIHLLPEAFNDAATTPLGTSLLVLAGMLLFFAVEKLIRHQHAGAPQGGDVVSTARHVLPGRGTPVPPEFLMVNVIGDSIHNFIDGALIAGSYLASPALGLSTTLAVACHELPQELGDFGVMVHGGWGVRKAVAVNLASAGTAVLGALVTLAMGQVVGRWVSELLLPITAGGFVYIATADLIPELQRDRSLGGLFVQVALMGLGVAVMAALTLLD